MIRVTIWDEDLQDKVNNETMKVAYPDSIRQAIAQAFEGCKDVDITLSHADLPGYGLSQEIIDQTDVLIFWAHRTHELLPEEVVDRIQKAVLDGMGFIPLHSAHLSKPFKRLMGTSCCLKYRYIDHARVFTTCPTHPIAKDMPEVFELQPEELYGEPFDVPKPDDVVFTSWFEGGYVFRGGCTWTRGHGKIFYFHGGHDTFPTFYDKNVQRMIKNAVYWCAPAIGRKKNVCKEVKHWREDSGAEMTH